MLISVEKDKRILTSCVESDKSLPMESGSDETDVKPKKKPGRKMMMTEPVNVCNLFLIEASKSDFFCLETKSPESSCSTSVPRKKGSSCQGT